MVKILWGVGKARGRIDPQKSDPSGSLNLRNLRDPRPSHLTYQREKTMWRIPTDSPDNKRKVEVVSKFGNRLNGTYDPASNRVSRRFRGIRIHVKWANVLKWRLPSD